MQHECLVSKQRCVLGVLLAWWSDGALCVYSLLDASVAEEDIGGDYYYQEEEENPGHFANQGKPFFFWFILPLPSFNIAFYLF
jgi:hypothetical protein